MNKKNFNLFFSSAVVLIVIFGMYFVWAVALPPTGLIIWENVTPAYDEGSFFVNWTSGGQNESSNYTIYFFAGNIYNGTDENNSATGYSVSGFSEANYTFIIESWNATGITVNSTTNISMYVDTTAPLVNWTGDFYENLTKKSNTDTLTLNISVGDALSGLTGSYCVFDINNTNETVDASSGWCNTTQLNLTNLVDGNYSIDIWANDTVNNVGVNLSTMFVWMDSTAPVATFTCSPSTIGNGADTICTCTGTDTGGVGVNDSLTTAAVTITSNSTFGTFTTGTNNCTITDNAGNTHNATGTYTVASDAATDRGSSSSKTPMRWTGTFVINEEQFSEGNTKQVAVNKRLRFKVKNINHHLGILELTGTTAKIEVSSTPQEATLSVGDTRKFDVSEDGYYDLVVTLNSILEGKADLTIKYISELITTESEVGEQEKEDAAEVAESEEEIQESSSIFKKWWFWLVVVLIVVGIGYYVKKNKR